MKILFTGGGTGGHIFPIIAITRELRKIYPQDIKFFYIGPRDDFSSVLLSQEGIKVKTICTGKVRRYLTIASLIQNFFDIFFKIPIGILQSFLYIFFLAPDLIFSKGGFGSFPPAIAGLLLQTPLFLHESDVAPGATNRFLSRFAKKIFVSFPNTEYFSQSKIILVGNPIRKEMLDESETLSQDFFKTTNEKPIILILGGSQGAQRINDEIFEVLPELLREFELIHQTGIKNFKQIENESKVIISEDLEKYYHPFPFFREQELKKAYQLADLIVSRAGAGSIFEIAALGKPSILVPISEAAQNHQIKNAYTYAQDGASQVLEEANFTSHFFLEKLKNLFAHPLELEKMSQAAQKFAKPTAATNMAKQIINYFFA
ncbi:MAG: undecaprenyldiphospho-muramoylpentapeptide beta-N-acetylglucosaminyltransferase [Patescibacteria group bacterium]|nr:undecaprenyldiphospho-muramoylpentapeptide beta-N-acetylglucosaminyltransferase [Patescibacteria group bacterium]MBU1877192.1 undecaprenyldiphospho-muramoylpentapeptide beta-N-acetylglucosaminyltransferase [Patescibacteria group bacterium]